MRLPYSIPDARTKILEQGIQQTNRYAMYYSGNNDMQYPYAITLPGYGYDLIDHSIWSINRKIPFRKTQTDVEFTFIVGNGNYMDYVYYWNNLISTPKDNNTILTDPGDSKNFAQENGISQDETENASAGQSDPDTIITSTGEQDIFGSGMDSPVILGGANLLNQNQSGIVNGYGGAVSYMNKIYSNELVVFLLAEDHSVRNTFIFEEAYISQISPVQLTSTETGYSPFKVSFRFATMRTG